MKRQKKYSQKHKVKQNHISKYKSSSFPVFNIWLLIGLIILIGIIAFSKYLSTEYLFYFKDIGSDSINQIYPGITQRLNLMKEGFFTKWTFFAGIGDAYVTSLSMEPYGIIRQLIDSLGGSIFGANYFILGRFIKTFVFYFLFSGIVFYFYLRTLSVKKFSSLIGGLLVTFSGYMVVGAGWGFSSHIFKAVVLLFAFEQLYLKKNWYFFPFAVIWLSTNVFTLYVYSLFLLIYSVFRYFSEKENKIIPFLKLTSKMIFLGLIGLLMNFSGVLLSLQKLFNSPRVSGNASYSQVLSGGNEIVEQTSIVSTTILRFFSNDLLGNGSNFKGWSNYLEAPLFYIGLLTLLIFPQVFIHLNKRKKIVFGSFLAFWGLTLFFPYLRHAILAFTGDYFRYGFDFFIPFTLLFFAVYSLNQIDKTFKINIYLLGTTLTILLIALFFPYKYLPPNSLNTDLRNIIVLLLIIYSVLLVLISKPKYKAYSQIGLLLLIVFELSYFSYKSYSEREPITKTEFNKDKGGYADGSIKAVNYLKSIDKTLFFRTEKDYQSGNTMHGSLNDAKAQGYYGTTSYSSFNQLNYVRFLEETGLITKGDETATRWITGFRNFPLLQTFGNVKYHLSKSEKPEFLRFGFDSLARIEGITILKNKYYLPFGYTYDKYIEFDDFVKLKYYILTPTALQNINDELSRRVQQSQVNFIITSVQPMLNKKFSSDSTFYSALKAVLSVQDFNSYKFILIKYSTQNFKNQIALLTCFVNEKGSDFIDTLGLTKLNPLDTSTFIEGRYFNFDKYAKLVNDLREDTFKIETFKQSRITGTIDLSKKKLVFFTIPYDKGWKIKVNGEVKELKRVNVGFTGIALDKGNYKIELYYQPVFFRQTLIITIIANFIFWAFLVFYFVRKRKKKIQLNSLL